MYKNNRVNRVLHSSAAALLTLTLSATYLPVNAEGDVSKNEDVFVILDANGNVDEITVSDTLHSDNGFDNYEDTSSLSDVENLKSDDSVNKTSDGYVWTSSENDIYYQGQSDKELPLDVSVAYTLDGKEISAEDLLNKSGHVQIKISLNNKETHTYNVNGKTYNVATPFVTMCGAMLNDKNFANVTSNVGEVTGDSSHKIVASILLPGMSNSIKDTLDDAGMSMLDDFLNDELVIEADTTDFTFPEIMVAATTSTDSLKEELNDSDFSSVFSDLDKLQDATDQLIDGADQINNGASQLEDGAESLYQGTITLNEGAIKLSDGASQLLDGTNQLASGTSQLRSGLEQLSNNSSALNDGASQIAQGILDTANKTLHSNEATKNVPDLTLDNYASVIGSITGAEDTRKAALQQVCAQTNQSEDITKVLIYLASIHTTGDFTADMQTQGNRLVSANEVSQITSETNNKEDALNNEKVVAILEGLRANLLNNLPTATDDQINTIHTSIAQTIKAQASMLSTLSDDQVNSIVTYALHQMYANNIEINQTNLVATLNASASSFNSETLSTILTTYSNPYEDELFNSFVQGIYKSQAENTIKSMSTSDLYDQLASSIKNVKDVDDSSIAKLLVYTANKYDSNTSLTDQIVSNASFLIDAQTVSVEMTNAKSESGQELINGVLDSLFMSSDSYSELLELENNLTGVKKFVEGLKSYTNGVDQAYIGSITLDEGAKQLVSGSEQLVDGSKQLADGSEQLKDGSSKLLSGIKKLKEGIQSLLDGLHQYNDDGISKLTNNDKINDLKDAQELIKQMKNSDEYTNYSGISEGTDGEVKFVYKINGIKSQKATTTTTSTDVTKSKNNDGFFKKLLNLFIFWK